MFFAAFSVVARRSIRDVGLARQAEKAVISLYASENEIRNIVAMEAQILLFDVWFLKQIH